MTRRRGAQVRRTQARRRPVVLFGALLAPAILAGGLLAGEVQGLEVEVPWVAPPARKVSAAVVWEPRLVPAPEVPERRYEGVVRVRVREEVSAPVVSEPRVPERSVEEAREETAAEQEVELAPGGCAGEWVDTWLGDLCRDWESEQRARESGDVREEEAAGGESWVPGV